VFDDQEDSLDRVIERVRRPVWIDPAVDVRVMRAITRRELPLGTRAWRWLVRPRRVAISPLNVLAATALTIAVVVVAARAVGRDEAAFAAPEFQFVLVAPQAATVALVGDFNDWDPQRTRMRAASRGMWTAVVPLAPGRHRYAFLVNGVDWVADPSAPTAADNEFGAPSSVVTVVGS
jgi:hypothetical protein